MRNEKNNIWVSKFFCTKKTYPLSKVTESERQREHPSAVSLLAPTAGVEAGARNSGSSPARAAARHLSSYCRLPGPTQQEMGLGVPVHFPADAPFK